MKDERKRKGCANCLHCKQSRFSTPTNILAFCEKKKKRLDRNIEYWETKKFASSLIIWMRNNPPPMGRFQRRRIYEQNV
jgi:hypothetical protein